VSAEGAHDDGEGDGQGEAPGEEAPVEGVGGGGGEGTDTIEGEGAAQDALLVRGEGGLTEGAGSEAGEGAAEGEGAEAGEEVQGHDEGEVHGRLLSMSGAPDRVQHQYNAREGRVVSPAVRGRRPLHAGEAYPVRARACRGWGL
jgi:hypothetical protein